MAVHANNMHPADAATVRRRLTIRGQVQGVGFRPFVFRLASEIGVGGFVRNDGAGVTIELQGERPRLDRFADRLRAELPPAARIDRLQTQPIDCLDDSHDFRILFSDHSKPARADVTVDMAVCDDCLRELFDPSDRRFGYPFINCTNCGPRYSIVNDVPYDRAMTTMAAFTMCPACQAEYDDPINRRFHAQPNACPQCGPAIWLITPTAQKGKRTPDNGSIATPAGSEQTTEQVIRSAVQAMLGGKIVAIRGLGGFHLAVRADDDAAVARLRERKGREHKPLALMVADLAAAEQLVLLNDAARKALVSPQRPIVIARRRAGAPVAESVAPGTDSLGVMLPYTPLHYLLFAELASQKDAETRRHGDTETIQTIPSLRVSDSPRPRVALIMTSGNISDEPIVAGNDEAVAALSRVADLFLLHNREIARRIDDSVVETVGRSVLPLRRARGFVPTGIELTGRAGFQPAQDRRLATCVTSGIAVGAELKSTIAVVRPVGDDAPQAVLSEHIGDLKDARVYRHFERVIAHLLQITHTVPAWIAHDMHPMYLSSTWARRQGLPLIAVQHHHAHIAACLAEHGEAGPVIGLAADGVGYGSDGTIWGGEIMLADLAGFERIGWFRPIRLPGGDAAAVQTARPALGWLFDATSGNVPGEWIDRLMPGRDERDIVLRQLADGFNCPASTALGRYFDAAAAILGIASANRFEAEAPIALESAVAPGIDDVLPFEVRNSESGIRNSKPSERSASSIPHSEFHIPNFQIDLRPALLEMLDRIGAGQSPGRLAAAFHNTIAAAMAAAVDRASELTGVRTVAASGGVFCNRYLSRRLDEQVAKWRGRELLMHRRVPANDGGIALGQAAIAASKWPMTTGH